MDLSDRSNSWRSSALRGVEPRVAVREAVMAAGMVRISGGWCLSPLVGEDLSVIGEC